MAQTEFERGFIAGVNATKAEAGSICAEITSKLVIGVLNLNIELPEQTTQEAKK